MNRETIIAISIGIGLGLIVGAVVLFQTKKSEETKVIPIAPENNKVVISPENPKTETKNKNLIISSPKSGVITTENSIEIRGKATPDSLVIVQSAADEVVEKNEKEEFKIQMKLSVGENTIQVSTYSDSSTPQEQTLRVYYLPKE